MSYLSSCQEQSRYRVRQGRCFLSRSDWNPALDLSVRGLQAAEKEKEVSLRDLANGQSCIRCGKDDGTIVLCHYTGVRRGALGGGMGIKVHDAVGAEMCSVCHHWMDTGSRDKERKWECSEEFLFLVALTWIRRIERGLVTIGRRAA